MTEPEQADLLHVTLYVFIYLKFLDRSPKMKMLQCGTLFTIINFSSVYIFFFLFIEWVGSSDGVDQDAYSTQGNSWIIEHYPKINFIKKASITYNCPVEINRF